MELKIGEDVISKRSKHKTPMKTYFYRSPYKRLLSEIEKIKTVEQVSIVGKMIQDAYSNGRITYAECNLLSSKLNEKTSNVGEKEAVIKAGPLGEFGVKKKGKIM